MYLLLGLKCQAGCTTGADMAPNMINKMLQSCKAVQL